jgi:hypothetical protein
MTTVDMQMVTLGGVVETAQMKDTQGQLVSFAGPERMQILEVKQTRESTSAAGLYPKLHKQTRSTLADIPHASPKPPVIRFDVENAGDIHLTVNDGGRVIVNAKKCATVTINGTAKLQNCTAQTIHVSDKASLVAEGLQADTVTVINGSLTMQATRACESIRLHGDIDSKVPIGAALTYKGPTDIRAKHNLVLPTRFERYRCNCREPCRVSRECRNFCQMIVGEFHMCSPCFIKLRGAVTEVKV